MLIKELIVVLSIALVTLHFVKPLALRFSAASDFARRRNIWIALTIVGFLSPSFWLFALIAVPILLWAVRQDSSPIALYMFVLFVVPAVPVDIPDIDGMQLFSLDYYRLLSFFVLIPLAVRARRLSVRSEANRSRSTDLFLLAFGAVQIWLFVPPDAPNHVIFHDSFTNFLRRIFLYVVDVYVVYYAISRSCVDRRKILDAISAFCVAAAVMSTLAVFEHFRRWLLYTTLALRWNPADANYIFSFMLRGTWLRAQVSAGSALILGLLLAIAFGFSVYLQSHSTTLRGRLMPALVYWSGLVASFSRGAWIGGITIYLAYSMLKPKGLSRLVKACFVIVIAVGLFSLSSSGQRMIDSLPFMGGKADSSVIYRQQLFDRSRELIEAHPWFGDQKALAEMESLRQGQGIIDIVNTYIGVALFDGLVGLALFLGFIVSACWGAYRAAKVVVSDDLDLAYLGFSLIACIIGMMIMIADCSLIYGVQKMFFGLVALAVAYARYVSSSGGMLVPGGDIQRRESRSIRADVSRPAIRASNSR